MALRLIFTKPSPRCGGRADPKSGAARWPQNRGRKLWHWTSKVGIQRSGRTGIPIHVLVTETFFTRPLPIHLKVLRHPQAQTVWQWARFLFAAVGFSGKRPLIVNLDETSIPVIFSDVKGTVLVRNGPAAWATVPRQRATKGEMRMYFTHVAMICNDPALQPILPQVIFVGAAALTKTQFHLLGAELPDNVYLKRMPKGWNNADEHKVIIELLAMVLAGHEDLQVILAFDAAPIHLAPKVLEQLRASGFLFLLVPAKLTWLLQPLDRCVFFRFKLYLKQRFTEAFLNGVSNTEKVPRMIRLVIQAIRYVLQKYTWEYAFRQTGLWIDQSSVAASIKRDLQIKDIPHIPCERPSAEMLRRCWPKNRQFDEDLVMSLVPADQPVPAASPGVSVSPASATSATGAACSSASSSSGVLPGARAAERRQRLRTKTTPLS